uniref:Uncharacterized protein n=1 Tax=Ananas comosus var. bracteatus TaxID=296719 RepID=A0A6V7PYG6_ANACO|nr:unnamed protein product [Ananas comosus var. bracteatus]
MIVKEKTCILAYATTLTTDGPTRLVDLHDFVLLEDELELTLDLDPIDDFICELRGDSRSSLSSIARKQRCQSSASTAPSFPTDLGPVRCEQVWDNNLRHLFAYHALDRG